MFSVLIILLWRKFLFLYNPFFPFFIKHFLCTFQILTPFLVPHPETPYLIPPPPASITVSPFPPPQLLLSCTGISLHWGIKPSQDQGTLFPLMSNKAILCYICGWSHGSLHVYSLVGGGLVPGRSWGFVWLMLSFLWGCKPLQLLHSFP
jgi:hypothetical protein